jgi:phosphocarrier protein HPr
MTKHFDHKKILKLVSKANQFDSYILIVLDQKFINAKSILSAAALNGINGQISLHAKGIDSEKALETLKQICIES